MKKLLLISLIFLFPLVINAQFQPCGNRINLVTLSPLSGTNIINVSINSECCNIHNLNNFTYNPAENSLNLCYLDTGLTMPSSITSSIELQDANNAGSQTLIINYTYYLLNSEEICSGITDFDSSITLTFEGPLTQSRVFTLDANSFETKKISLFPNPNNGNFYIELPNPTNQVAVTIVDLYGKLIYKTDNYTSGNLINNQNLAKGFYLAKITQDKENKTLKFIIK
ncbi:T9SS type A sorting domain-containing protein [Flavobacterium sp.]